MRVDQAFQAQFRSLPALPTTLVAVWLFRSNGAPLLASALFRPVFQGFDPVNCSLIDALYGDERRLVPNRWPVEWQFAISLIELSGKAAEEQESE